ncbi:anthranilate synthase component II [Celerinatantimonas diazotrophica]|uniref:Anthranilate synthase component 2 n=1 Tax=Celerinatantimonas diazotrophica TaxID=412034 RepID=A0A4R1K140_9GAMM|nr:aminodeoxychorismate/anthranilate synthase component II [Celerinatantimonas diazotrophica]TCK57706.1 anthranilate synthase component 2 [Celerinatantimonas diazotrophica]CAG9298232.1 Anthranilate synthase component 2 [Celerinatantimonas diazotrophica]
MLLIIDNYDSFTYNLYQYFAKLGEQVCVYRHDEITIAEIEQLAPNYLVISPGPKAPQQAGISLSVIQQFAGKIPILGVCLGHQCIAEYFGATIVRAPQLMHGKTSPLHHDGQGVFATLPSPFSVTRYHSLMVDAEHLPECFEVTAWTYDECDSTQATIMGIRHKTMAIEGVQFHPESILSEHGLAMLHTFLESNKSN